MKCGKIRCFRTTLWNPYERDQGKVSLFYMRCRQPKILYTIFAVESVNSSHQKNLAAAIQTKRDIESRQNIMRDIIIATYHFTHYQDMITKQPKVFVPRAEYFLGKLPSILCFEISMGPSIDLCFGFLWIVNMYKVIRHPTVVYQLQIVRSVWFDKESGRS
jgi:hypothetical protein